MHKSLGGMDVDRIMPISILDRQFDTLSTASNAEECKRPR